MDKDSDFGSHPWYSIPVRTPVPFLIRLISGSALGRLASEAWLRPPPSPRGGPELPGRKPRASEDLSWDANNSIAQSILLGF